MSVLRVYVFRRLCSQDLRWWMSMFSGSMFSGSVFMDVYVIRVYVPRLFAPQFLLFFLGPCSSCGWNMVPGSMQKLWFGTWFHQVPGHFRELILPPVSDPHRVRVLDYPSIASAFPSFSLTALPCAGLGSGPALHKSRKHFDPYTIKNLSSTCTSSLLS